MDLYSCQKKKWGRVFGCHGQGASRNIALLIMLLCTEECVREMEREREKKK